MCITIREIEDLVVRDTRSGYDKAAMTWMEADDEEVGDSEERRDGRDCGRVREGKGRAGRQRQQREEERGKQRDTQSQRNTIEGRTQPAKRERDNSARCSRSSESDSIFVVHS